MYHSEGGISFRESPNTLLTVVVQHSSHTYYSLDDVGGTLHVSWHFTY